MMPPNTIERSSAGRLISDGSGEPHRPQSLRSYHDAWQSAKVQLRAKFVVSLEPDWQSDYNRSSVTVKEYHRQPLSCLGHRVADDS